MAAVRRATEAFHRLHEDGVFVMPNPWDVGSAVTLERMGFPALATTSAGAAWSLGRADRGLRLDDALAHLRQLAEAVAVPLNADFEGGYAVEPEQVAEHVAAAVATGIAGLSIEDSTGDAEHPMHDRALAIERVAAARRAIDESGTGVLLTARSEGFVVGRPDLAETVARLQAYAEAGADCLYAPRLSTADEVAAVVAAVAPKPVNLLLNAPFLTVAQAADLGVRRISVGGTLARAAWGGWLAAAEELREHGTVTRFAQLPDVDGMLGAPSA
jgi:2-methylisocitrate lyase-like PEP mutase family enzyme